jgi:hypothetical protein
MHITNPHCSAMSDLLCHCSSTTAIAAFTATAAAVMHILVVFSSCSSFVVHYKHWQQLFSIFKDNACTVATPAVDTSIATFTVRTFECSGQYNTACTKYSTTGCCASVHTLPVASAVCVWHVATSNLRFSGDSAITQDKLLIMLISYDSLRLVLADLYSRSWWYQDAVMKYAVSNTTIFYAKH